MFIFVLKQEIKIVNTFKVKYFCSVAVYMVLSLCLLGAQPTTAAGWLRLCVSPWLGSLPKAWLHIREHWSVFLSFIEVFLGSCALTVVQRRDQDSAEAVNDYIMSQKRTGFSDLFCKVCKPIKEAKCEMISINNLHSRCRSLFEQPLGKRQENTLDIHQYITGHTHTHSIHPRNRLCPGFDHKGQK